jgi:hypothetical protein
MAYNAMTAIPPARSIIQEAINIPNGVRLYELKTHVDHRGEFTELFRETWSLGPRPLQWNLVWSSANVLRGVHVHREHADYLTVGAGELILGLHDMRPSAATYGRSMLLRLRADDPYIAVVPPAWPTASTSASRPVTSTLSASASMEATNSAAPGMTRLCAWPGLAQNPFSRSEIGRPGAIRKWPPRSPARSNPCRYASA